MVDKYPSIAVDPLFVLPNVLALLEGDNAQTVALLTEPTLAPST
jgi:hypothetical protein